jgi:hypothetical protein
MIQYRFLLFISRGVIALADAIPNSGLTRIELGYLHITDAAALALASAIKLSTTLATVTLDHCKGITEEGGRALVKALENNVTMTQLGLKGTSVGAPIRNAAEALLSPAGLVKRQCGTADSVLNQMTSAPAPVPAKTLVKGLKGIKSLKPDAPGPSGFSSSGGSVGSGSARLALVKGGKVADVTPRKGIERMPSSSRSEAKGSASPRSMRSHTKAEAPAPTPADAKESVVSSPMVAAEAKVARKNLLLLKGKMAERSKRASFGSSDPEGLAGCGPVVSPETLS